MFLEVHASGPADTNCILLGCPVTKSAALIDAPAGCLPWVTKHVKKHQLSLEKLLLTHSHWDHIADSKALKDHFSLDIYVHPEDAGNLENPGSDGLPLLFDIDGVKPDHFLKDGMILTIGSLSLQVLDTPGHTPGCVCFWLPEQKILISGDTLFQGTIGNLSFPTARPSLMWSSLKKLASLPPDTHVIPGHGPPTTLSAESWISHAEEFF
ncbi:MAG: MBL fold metallo-hydrolase [Verrucomicrobia bacterium]|nr:MBL fold metallo-hydrolase [Verrucomicrobiota bacterium]